LYRSSKDPSESILKLNFDSLDEESIDEFVGSINWDKEDFSQYLNSEGKICLLSDYQSSIILSREL